MLQINGWVECVISIISALEQINFCQNSIKQEDFS